MSNSRKIDRRTFIELSVIGAVGTGLTTTSMLLNSGCSNDNVRTVHGACYHDCPDRCSWVIKAKDNQILNFQASKDNPYTAGKLCSKMENFPNDVTYHPDRILTPLKRVGKKGEGKFEPISWEKAIGEVASKLNALISQYGGESILPYSFGGNQGMVQSDTISTRFFAQIGATKLERSICGNTAVAGIMATNGQTTGVLPEDIIHSRYIILWGTNPVNSNQHLWPFIQKAKSNGAKIVVVDPFVSRTAEKADWHIQPLPGTDTVLALGMIHVILKEGLQDEEYIADYTEGLEELTRHVQQYDAEKVAEITGLEEDTVINLAREYAQGSPSLIRVLIGMEHQANGGSAFRSIAMLPALTGAWREFGGGMMNMTYELFGESLNWEKFDLPQPIAETNTRTVNMVKLGKALTDPDIDPPIKAMIVFNSNLVATTPNQNLIIEGLRREDLLTVVLEHFITDTARYADLIFPATTVLENWDILDSWGTPYLNINQPAIDPLGESKPNTEFFRLLAREMGYKEDYLYEPDIEFVKSVMDSDHAYLDGSTFESILKTGWVKLKTPDKWTPHAEGNFNTPSGKCMFYRTDMQPSLPEYHPVTYSDQEKMDYPFHLMSIKNPENFLNSSHANLKYLRDKEGDPWIDLSEHDGSSLNIKDGDAVKVYNQRGEVFVTARLRKKVRPGIVCIPQGFWPSYMKGGRSVNALTDDRLTDMGGGGAIQEARVAVVKV
jgi:anaerobic selenocysteine-containing dehydrogenase